MTLKTGAILVVGANGSFGECLLQELRRKYPHTSLFGTTRRFEPTKADFTVYAPDLTEGGCSTLQNQLEQHLRKHNLHLDMIYLVAASACPTSRLTPDRIQEMYTVNRDMVKWWGTQYPTVPMVFISTSAVYGTKGTVSLECYSDSKRQGEAAFLASTTKAPRIIVRFTQVYTNFLTRAGMDKETSFSPLIAISPEKAAQKVVREVLKKRTLILVGWATKVLDFLHNIDPTYAQVFMKL